MTSSLSTVEGQLAGDESSTLLSQITQLEILDDREIIAFIQTTDPVYETPGKVVGNGDIWVDTDRYATANDWSISRWQNTTSQGEDGHPAGFWANPQDGYPVGAFGKFYLSNYQSALASNKNLVQRGYSLFDSRTGEGGDYAFGTTAELADSVSPNNAGMFPAES